MIITDNFVRGQAVYSVDFGVLGGVEELIFIEKDWEKNFCLATKPEFTESQLPWPKLKYIVYHLYATKREAYEILLKNRNEQKESIIRNAQQKIDVVYKDIIAIEQQLLGCK